MSVSSTAPFAVLSLALLGAPSTGFSQTPPPAEPLRLGAVYRALDAWSPMLRAASASARAAVARIGPVSHLPDPTLQLSTMNRDLPGFDLNDPLGMNQIQLMQMIPLGGRIGLSTDVARARARAEEAKVPDVILAQRAFLLAQPANLQFQFVTLFSLPSGEFLIGGAPHEVPLVRAHAVERRAAGRGLHRADATEPVRWCAHSIAVVIEQRVFCRQPAFALVEVTHPPRRHEEGLEQ